MLDLQLHVERDRAHLLLAERRVVRRVDAVLLAAEGRREELFRFHHRVRHREKRKEEGRRKEGGKRRERRTREGKKGERRKEERDESVVIYLRLELVGMSTRKSV